MSDMQRQPLDSPEMACDLLVIGDPGVATPLADVLRQTGLTVFSVLSAPPAKDPHRRDAVCAEVVQCDGFTGDYRLRAVNGKQSWRIQSAAIVVALDEHCVPEYGAFGLTPGPRVHALRQTETAIAQGRFGNSGETIVLLSGVSHESHPAVTGRMLTLCFNLKQQHPDCTVVFITGNLKVADHGLEALTDAVRQQGTFIYKLDGQRPTIQSGETHRLRISFFDPVMRQNIEMTADRLIVDERIIAPTRIASLAALLGIRSDPAGFAQEDNIRRLGHLTNRRGIFVAGAARGVLSEEERRADSAALCAAVTAFLAGTDRTDFRDVTIETDRCGRCLTCYRSCPYGAVKIGDHMEVVPEACQACGLCVAGCPAKAIRMQAGELDERLAVLSGPSAPPLRIVAFCCQRSAAMAIAAARAQNAGLPAEMICIQVPCGGRVGTNDIVAAFEADAAGVLVLTCQNDNCHSHDGSHIARKRTEAARNALAAAGIAPERVCFAHIAANMESDLVRLCQDFGSRLGDLAREPGTPDETRGKGGQHE